MTVIVTKQIIFGALLLMQAAASAAQGVDETNYDHIDPSVAIVIPGFYSAKNLRQNSQAFRQVTLGAAVAQNQAQGLSIVASPYSFDSVAFVFEEDACSIGIQLKMPPREEYNSIPVEFGFIARDGSLIETEKRWPASGTTRQSFSSQDFASRFAAVEIRSATVGEMEIGDVRILPCSLAVS